MSSIPPNTSVDLFPDFDLPPRREASPLGSPLADVTARYAARTPLSNVSITYARTGSGSAPSPLPGRSPNTPQKSVKEQLVSSLQIKFGQLNYILLPVPGQIGEQFFERFKQLQGAPDFSSNLLVQYVSSVFPYIFDHDFHHISTRLSPEDQSRVLWKKDLRILFYEELANVIHTALHFVYGASVSTLTKEAISQEIHKQLILKCKQRIHAVFSQKSTNLLNNMTLEEAQITLIIKNKFIEAIEPHVLFSPEDLRNLALTLGPVEDESEVRIGQIVEQLKGEFRKVLDAQIALKIRGPWIQKFLRIPRGPTFSLQEFAEEAHQILLRSQEIYKAFPLDRYARREICLAFAEAAQQYQARLNDAVRDNGFECFAEFLADTYEKFALENVEAQMRAALSNPPARVLTDQVGDWIKDMTRRAIDSLQGAPHLVERTESEREPIGPKAGRRHETLKQTVAARVEFLAMECRSRHLSS